MPVRFPILVIANQRCGSNSYAITLANRFYLKLFLEPHRVQDNFEDFKQLLSDSEYTRNVVNRKYQFRYSFSKFKEHTPIEVSVDNQQKNTDRFIVKIISTDISLYPEYGRMLASSCYKIRLRRLDRISQIASHYIMRTTERVSRKPGEPIPEYAVPLDLVALQRSIDVIDEGEKALDALPSSVFDEDITYESLGYMQGANDLTSQPTNLDEIKSAIKYLTVK